MLTVETAATAAAPGRDDLLAAKDADAAAADARGGKMVAANALKESVACCNHA
jgi:hypothetical protein